jgi:hypothetical protein
MYVGVMAVDNISVDAMTVGLHGMIVYYMSKNKMTVD